MYELGCCMGGYYDVTCSNIVILNSTFLNATVTAGDKI